LPDWHKLNPEVTAVRDNGKEQLQNVDNLIRKAKDSLGKMEEFDVPKTLQTEFVDLIPLGNFPENKEEDRHHQHETK